MKTNETHDLDIIASFLFILTLSYILELCVELTTSAMMSKGRKVYLWHWRVQGEGYWGCNFFRNTFEQKNLYLIL